MKPPILSVRTSEVTESGLFRSVHPLDAPLWRDGRNVLFRDGGPEKIGGWTAPLTVAGAGVIRGMDASQDETGIQRLFFGDQTRLWTWNGATLAEIGSGFTGQADETVNAPATAWSFARFGNWMLATNGVNPPRIWKGSGASTALSGVNFTRAEILLRRGPHILAFNTSNGASWYQWSSDDDPEVWATSSTNAAGDQNIRDMNGPIIAAVPMGERIAVLGRNQLFLVDYVGDPFYFTYRPALDGIGAVGKHACVAANGRLYGMARGGMWETDGVTYRYIDTLALRTFWQGQVDTTQLSKVFCHYDAGNETVWWHLPTTATKEPTFAVGYRIANRSWTVADYGRTAAVPQLGVYRLPVMAGADGKIYFHNTGTEGAGQPITAYVQTKPLGGEQQAHTYLDQILIQARRLAGSVQVRVGTQKHLDDAIAWGPYRPLDDGFEPMNYRTSGRYLTIEVRSDTTGADWAISGFDLHGRYGGRGA